MLAAGFFYRQYNQGSLNNVPGVSFNHQVRQSSFRLNCLNFWKFWTLQFLKPDHPVLLNWVQQNRFQHPTSAEDRTIQFGKLEHPIFSRTYSFPWFDRKPDTYNVKSFATIFSSLETFCTVKLSKRVIISRHLSRYVLKDPSKHW
jgi:hypothetical protein